MARDIAHGEVVIGVDLDKVGAELAHAEAQFSRAMANIDRMKAEAEAKLDTKGLHRDIAETKAALRALEADKINPEVKLDKSAKAALNKDINTLRAKLKALDAEKIIIDVDAKEVRDAAKAEEALRKERALGDKEALRRTRAEEGLQKMWRDGAAMQQRAIDMDRKRSVEIEKLRLQYIKLHDEIEKGQKLELLGFLGDETARRKFARTRAELEQVGSKLREMGDSDDDLLRLAHASDNAGGRLRTMLNSVSSIRLQMGFFSATLRQTAIGFTALGPVLFGLAGQLSALIGVLGTGLAGALAVSAAGVIGFAGAALGVGLIMKPMIGDLQDAKKASDAYGDAVRKYGKDSSQAQTAQEKLNQTLGDVGPDARAAFASLGTMSDRWSELTDGNRARFFDTFAKGIQLANRTMPMFARESNKTFGAAMNAADRWIGTFSSPEAQTGIRSILSNFRAAIPGLNSGFLALGKSIGAIGASASRWLQPLAEGFSDWAENIFTNVNSGGLDATIDRMVSHLQQLGHFAQSAGRMLATFFNAGANEGAALLTTLTDVMNRWTAWMQSARGQEGLSEFFSQANQIGSQFIGTLANIGVALFEFSQAFAPLSQGAIAFVRAISSVVAAVMGLGAARGVVTTIGGALAGAFVAGKIMAAAAAFQALRTAMLSLQAAGGIVGAFAAMSNPIMLAAAGLGAVAAGFYLLETSADQAGDAMDDLGSSMARTKALIDGLANADSAAASAKLDLMRAQMEVNRTSKVADQMAAKYGEKSRQAKQADLAAADAKMYLHDAQMRVVDSGKAQWKAQREVLRSAQQDVRSAAELVEETSAAAERGTLDKFVGGLNALQDFNLKGSVQAVRDLKRAMQGGASDAEIMAMSQELYADATRQAAKASDAQALSLLNMQRRMKGTGDSIVPLSDKLAASWGRIKDNLPRGGSELFKIADPKEAAQMIRLTDKLSSFGKGAQAAKILVDTKNVDQALAKLKALTKKSTTLVEAKVNKGKAEREIQSLGKGKTATINAKANTKGAERDMAKLSGKQLVNRITIRANSAGAISELNKVQRYNLRRKLLDMGANPAAVTRAINIINKQRLAPKVAEFKAKAAEAEAADKKVQGFKNKTVTATTKWSGESEMAAARSAIAAIQSKSVTVTTNYRTNGTPPGRAAGGPTAGAYAPMPAQERRNAQSADRASVRANRPGVYRRPTLLVGEETQKEWVIASNDAYRGANERYLRDAAHEFGYALTPFDEMAWTGKDNKKKKVNGAKSAQKYAKTRSGRTKYNKKSDVGGYSYDYIQAQINQLSDKSSNLETERSANLERNPDADPNSINPALSSVLSPLDTIKSKWYRELEYNLKRRASKSALAADKAGKRLRGKNGLETQLKAAQAKVKRTRNRKTSTDAQKKQKEKDLRTDERDLERIRRARDNARTALNSRGDNAGALWRELQQVSNDRKALDNRIRAIQDGDKGSEEDDPPDTPMGLQLASLDKTRYDLFREFGSNLAPVSPVGTGGSTPLLPGGMGAVSSPSFYQSSGSASGVGASIIATGAPASVVTAGVSSGGSAPAGRSVTQNINISEPPPDPHSFARALGWEAQMV